MNMSKEQVQDILILRRLFFENLGRILRIRKALAVNMSNHDHQLTDMAKWSQLIQQTVQEEQDMFEHMMVATRIGVGCPIVAVMHICCLSDVLSHLKLGCLQAVSEVPAMLLSFRQCGSDLLSIQAALAVSVSEFTCEP